jgi:hypothetical protein
VHAPVAARPFTPRPPGSQNSLLKFGVLGLVVVALAGAGYFYGLPLLTKAFEQEPDTKSSAGAKASQTDGSGSGPLGEVNGAMDVSETLDGGASSKSRPAPRTNNAVRPKPAASH